MKKGKRGNCLFTPKIHFSAKRRKWREKIIAIFGESRPKKQNGIYERYKRNQNKERVREEK